MNDRYSECPECLGEGYPLGRLAVRMWVRCRDCGWVYLVDDPGDEDDFGGDSEARVFVDGPFGGEG